MKKLLLLVAAVFFAMTSNAQIFNESQHYAYDV